MVRSIDSARFSALDSHSPLVYFSSFTLDYHNSCASRVPVCRVSHFIITVTRMSCVVSERV